MCDEKANDVLATCIGCGCDDNNACIEETTNSPCYWMRLETAVKKGVCSNCKDHMKRWDDGDRSIKALNKEQ